MKTKNNKTNNKTNDKKQSILILVCMSLLMTILPAGTCSAVSVAPIVSAAPSSEAGGTPAASTQPVGTVQPETSLYAAKKSDVWISNFQNWTKKRVVFGTVSPMKMGMDGNEIEVSEAKSGKVVYSEENALLFDGAKTGVLYRYRIRYNKRVQENPSQRVSGAWSEYRYFGIPKLTGTRTTKKVQVKWKKMWGAVSYDIYKVKGKMQLKRTLGRMEASSWPAGKYAGKLQKIKSLAKNKTQVTMKITNNKITYVVVVPKFKIKGKNVKNDLESYVYH